MEMSSSLLAVSIFTIFLCIDRKAIGWAPPDPTEGFVSLPLNSSNFQIQKPWNLLENQRYRFIDGIHWFWVFSTDQSLSRNSNTKPRSEIRIRGYDYSSGVWQFEGYGYVPNGTSGVCIMQLFRAKNANTTLMIRVYDGKLMYYKREILVPYIYDEWFRLNVIHDVGAGKVSIFINGILKLEFNDSGGTFHYFKCGVYAQGDDSYYMESRWKGIKVLKKCD
ncbi:citrate-binding protein-like [Tasmannia lanceolata]|uniref:citrate-binding protein-like n=1 Tax=Tasmannia lanceolata TaxID=3420 RepID=UPI0040637F78